MAVGVEIWSLVSMAAIAAVDSEGFHGQELLKGRCLKQEVPV